MDIPFVPGLPPTGPYEFLVLPAVKTLWVSVSSGPLPPSAQVETDLWMRDVPADRQDLVDGQRVYRVAVLYLNRCAYDKKGPFVGFPPVPQWRFVLTDPTLGLGVTRAWQPIGCGPRGLL